MPEREATPGHEGSAQDALQRFCRDLARLKSDAGYTHPPHVAGLSDVMSGWRG